MRENRYEYSCREGLSSLCDVGGGRNVMVMAGVRQFVSARIRCEE